jgi:hypothetical protein
MLFIITSLGIKTAAKIQKTKKGNPFEFPLTANFCFYVAKKRGKDNRVA